MTNEEKLLSEHETIIDGLNAIGVCPYFGDENKLCKSSDDCITCIADWLRTEATVSSCDTCKIPELE